MLLRFELSQRPRDGVVATTRVSAALLNEELDTLMRRPASRPGEVNAFWSCTWHNLFKHFGLGNGRPMVILPCGVSVSASSWPGTSCQKFPLKSPFEMLSLEAMQVICRVF